MEGNLRASLGAGRRRDLRREGFAQTPLSEVARTVHVNLTVPYRYFGDKAGLFRAAFVRKQAKLAVRMIRAAASVRGDPWKAFEAMCLACVEGGLDESILQIVFVDGPLRAGERNRAPRHLFASIRVFQSSVRSIPILRSAGARSASSRSRSRTIRLLPERRRRIPPSISCTTGRIDGRLRALVHAAAITDHALRARRRGGRAVRRLRDRST
jgi:AcrR family transcriptional regulator